MIFEELKNIPQWGLFNGPFSLSVARSQRRTYLQVEGRSDGVFFQNSFNDPFFILRCLDPGLLANLPGAAGFRDQNYFYAIGCGVFPVEFSFGDAGASVFRASGVIPMLGPGIAYLGGTPFVDCSAGLLALRKRILRS